MFSLRKYSPAKSWALSAKTLMYTISDHDVLKVRSTSGSVFGTAGGTAVAFGTGVGFSVGGAVGAGAGVRVGAGVGAGVRVGVGAGVGVTAGDTVAGAVGCVDCAVTIAGFSERAEATSTSAMISTLSAVTVTPHIRTAVRRRNTTPTIAPSTTPMHSRLPIPRMTTSGPTF